MVPAGSSFFRHRTQVSPPTRAPATAGAGDRTSRTGTPAPVSQHTLDSRAGETAAPVSQHTLDSRAGETVAPVSQHTLDSRAGETAVSVSQHTLDSLRRPPPLQRRPASVCATSKTRHLMRPQPASLAAAVCVTSKTRRPCACCTRHKVLPLLSRDQLRWLEPAAVA